MMKIENVTPMKWETCPVCGGEAVMMPKEERQAWAALSSKYPLNPTEKALFRALDRKMRSGRHIGFNEDC